jgi:hypothetical protein
MNPDLPLPRYCTICIPEVSDIQTVKFFDDLDLNLHMFMEHGDISPEKRRTYIYQVKSWTEILDTRQFHKTKTGLEKWLSK